MKNTTLLLIAAISLVLSGCASTAQESLSMTSKNVIGATTASITAGDGGSRHWQEGDKKSAGALTVASQNMAQAAAIASQAAPIYAKKIVAEAAQ